MFGRDANLPLTRLLILAGVLLWAAGASAQLLERKAVSLAEARKMTDAAIAEATKQKQAYAVAIVDAGGQLVYFARMDDAAAGGGEAAIAKARSAALFKQPTKTFQDRVHSGDTGLLRLENAVPIEGGVPLLADNKVIGAIGAAGATPDIDGQIAAAGAAALGK